jgi:hypothetical protein
MSEIIDFSKSTAWNIAIFIKSKLISKSFDFSEIQANKWVPKLENNYCPFPSMARS